MAHSIPITDSIEVRDQITRIAHSNSFRRRRKLLTLLEYLVNETISGKADQLTQRKIATDLFSPRDSSDHQSDVAVRISASRLRDALEEYYRREAEPGEIRIHMPPRNYYIAVERPSGADQPDVTSTGEETVFNDSTFSKKLPQNQIIGQLGINLIEKICLDLGFVWYPTGLEAGIDGYIEIRLPTGEVTNCIIQVQSKATDQTFEAESPTTFEFRCSARDLDYWLAGNAPVILVRSRPKTDEAYWISLKDYFSDVNKRKSAKILFDKSKDRFDASARSALQHLAVRKDSGLYLGTRPKNEIVYSNLLEVSSFPRKYQVAATEYRTRGEIFAALREFGRNVQGEWILGSKTLTSFHDLSVSPWTKVCDRGSVEELDTNEWAYTDDPARQREFVRLLNACLREKLYRKGVKYSREDQSYYFRASQDLSQKVYAYQSREHRASRSVFRGYPNKRDHSRMSYYRHSACVARFVRYGPRWYLQITPSYHFTRDGERLSRYSPDLLSGIKRLETNQAVHGQVVMWAHLLTERNLFDGGQQFLQFGSLLNFQVPAGLEDDTWLNREDDPEKRAALQAPAVDDLQGSLVL